tara:strand:- start:4919 stop:5092 length:174 start_codon:yes stop_codon:yes gene_type:complete
MPDTHNLNAALYTILINNGITEVKKIVLKSKKKEIEFIDQNNRKVIMNFSINENKEY